MLKLIFVYLCDKILNLFETICALNFLTNYSVFVKEKIIKIAGIY